VILHTCVHTKKYFCKSCKCVNAGIFWKPLSPCPWATSSLPSSSQWRSLENSVNFVCTYVCMYQGCQIFLGPNIPKCKKYTKWPQTLPKGHKLYQMAVRYSKWSWNITTYSITRPSKFYQNWDFLVWKQTICQHWYECMYVCVYVFMNEGMNICM
jgi:hypothetical protein